MPSPAHDNPHMAMYPLPLPLPPLMLLMLHRCLSGRSGVEEQWMKRRLSEEQQQGMTDYGWTTSCLHYASHRAILSLLVFSSHPFFFSFFFCQSRHANTK